MRTYWFKLVSRRTPLCRLMLIAVAMAVIQSPATTELTSIELFTYAYVEACARLGRAIVSNPEEAIPAAREILVILFIGR
jgi:hypothetical protein